MVCTYGCLPVSDIKINNTTITTCQILERKDNGCDFSHPCVYGMCNHIAQERGVHAIECVCDPGWVGPYCDSCCPLVCHHGGVCEVENEDDVRGQTCRCTRGWTGARCDTSDDLQQFQGNNCSLYEPLQQMLVKSSIH